MSSREPFDTAYDAVRWWQPRLEALEGVLGPAGEQVFHAPIPFDAGSELGGAPDILMFGRHQEGAIAYVTAELIGRDNQPKSDLSNYELVMCLPADVESDWATDILTLLSYYTLEQPLNPGDTSDLGDFAPEGSEVSALLFSAYGRFRVLERECGLLLCVGITEPECEYASQQAPGALEGKLREGGAYPVTDFARSSVV